MSLLIRVLNHGKTFVRFTPGVQLRLMYFPCPTLTSSKILWIYRDKKNSVGKYHNINVIKTFLGVLTCSYGSNEALMS